jgi:tetratricopeptide (TPR) repeat protein
MKVRTLKGAREKFGVDHPTTLIVMNNLANTCHDVGRFEEAIRLHQETLKLRRAKLGADHPLTLFSMFNLACTLRSVGRYQQAIPLHEQSLKLRRDKLGNDHPATLMSIDKLAVAYRSAKRYEEAIRLHQEAISLMTENLGPQHRSTLAAMNNLVGTYHSAGRKKESTRLAGELVKRVRKTLTAGRDAPFRDDPRLATLCALLGENLLKQAKFSEAEEFLAECLRIRAKRWPDLWFRYNAEHLLGAAYLGLGQLDKAEPLLLSGYHGMKHRESKISQNGKHHFTDAVRRLVELYERKNDPARAAAWRRKLPVAAVKPPVVAPRPK